MIKESIILVGGGGHCKSCIDVIESENRFKIIGIVDVKEKVGQKILNYEIIATDEDIPYLSKEYNFFLITSGQIKTPELRIRLFNLLKSNNVTFPVIFSPNAYISKHSIIGEGTIIMHQAIINADSKIGKNCIINTKSLIEHDTVIGNHCHISTGSIVNGGVHIGDGTFFGSGAVSKQYINIPENSFIKANSIVK